MRRRAAINLLAPGLLLWPIAGFGQESDRIKRIVVLQELESSDPESQRRIALFERALEALGWKKGRNLQVEYYWGGGDLKRTRSETIKAIRSSPDVIFTAGTSVIEVVAPETKSISVVFVLVSDPVALGFVSSLAHPGGNVTGFSVFEPGIGGKWLQLLKEAVPKVTQVTFLYNPATAPIGTSLVRELSTIGPTFGLNATAAPVHDSKEIEHAIATMASQSAGLIVAPDTFTYIHRDEIIALTSRYRLPAIYPFRDFVQSGGLLSYGVDLLAPFEQAPTYIDRILKGAKPAELPVQNPTKFELLINLGAAKKLGLALPHSLLQRADEVIE
jgi:putative ABC transport system substrate-binding protein